MVNLNLHPSEGVSFLFFLYLFCMYVFVSLCLYVCACVYLFVRMSLYLCVCVYVFVCMYVCAGSQKRKPS